MTLLGCSTQIFAGQPLDEFLPLIAESGYVEIELCSSPVEHPILPPIELDRPSSYYTDLKRKISLFGLNIESLGGTFGIEVGNPKFDRVVEICHMMEVSVIAIESAGLANNDEAFSWLLNAVNQSSILAAQAEVKIMLRPCFGQSVYSLETATKFVKSVDPDWVGINFDASQLWVSEPKLDPIDSLNQLKDYIFGFRLRDCRRGQLPTADNQQIPGQCDVDFSALAEFSAEIETVSAVILDLRSDSHHSLDILRQWLDKSVQYLQPLFD